MRDVSLGPPWSPGFGVCTVPSLAGDPKPSSVPPPCRGGSEKEWVRDPACSARKAEKAEVRGVTGPSDRQLGPHHADPGRFPQS